MELAEIGLEQQMLKELSLIPKGSSGSGSQEQSASGGGKTQKSSKQGGIISDPVVVQDAKATKESRGGAGKKSKQPIAFDIGAMITALEVTILTRQGRLPVVFQCGHVKYTARQ